MATYSLSLTMTAHETGTVGHYPIYQGSSSYSTTTTMWAKQGDTVTYVITEGDGSTVHFYDNTDPNPTATGTGTYPVMSSGASWSHTITSANDNAEIVWYFFGGTVGAGGGRKYSNRIVTRRVAGAFTNSDGASVSQGSTITFGVSGIAGLPSVSGASNYLYIAIRKGGTMVHTTGASGLAWDSGNNQLGKVHESDTSTVLTIGASMTAGTDYSAHLYHYNPNGTSYPFYDPNNQLDSVDFTVVASNTGTVSGIDLGPDIDVDQQLSYTLERNSGTITCDPTTFEPTCSVAATAGSNVNPLQRIKNADGSYATTTYVSDNLTLTNGKSVDFKMTGPAGYDSTNTGKLTIAEDEDSVSVTTQPDDSPGGGGGGGAGGSYGLRVYNPDGDVIFGDGIKAGHQISSQSITTPLASDASATYTLTNVPYGDADSARVGIIIVDMYTGSSQLTPYWSVSRSNNSGNLAFTVTNGSEVARPYRYIVTRY